MTYLMTAIGCFVIVMACAGYISYLLYYQVAALQYLKQVVPQLEERGHSMVDQNTLMHAEIPRVHMFKENTIICMRILGLVFPANMMFVGAAILNFQHNLTTFLAGIGTAFAIAATAHLRAKAVETDEICKHYDGIIASYELEDEINDPNNTVE